MANFMQNILDTDATALYTMGGNKRRRLSQEELDNMMATCGNADFEITSEHRQLVRHIFTDHANVFLTGGAGTGKTSFIINVLIPAMSNRGYNFAMTATTGIAGSHFGGKTIHSWAGIGLGPYFNPMENYAQSMTPEEQKAKYEDTYRLWRTNKRMYDNVREGVKKRIRAVEVLLIDEISMCPGAGLLNYLDFFFKIVRDSEEPFGGIQMIFVGDFAQIPPVEKAKKGFDDPTHADWAFLSQSWSEANIIPVQLTKVFRQKDVEFANFLNDVRVGNPTSKEYRKRFEKKVPEEELKNYTFLVPTNKQADEFNKFFLEQYPKPTMQADARILTTPETLKSWETLEKVRTQLLAGKLIKYTLSLRVGLPVLLTVNDRNGLYVNGTIAFIESFHKGETDDDDYIVLRLNKVDGPKHHLFRYAYTRNQLEDPTDLIMVADKETGKMKEVCPHPILKQFPLIPASAQTCHKAQGQSLDRGILSIGNAFLPGQVYGALSRLRTAEGLVLDDSDFQVMVDQDVMKYYQTITVCKDE